MKHLSAICQQTLSVPGAKLWAWFSQGAPVLSLAPNCSWHSSSSPGLPKPDVFMWGHWPDWQEFLAWHKADAACNNAQWRLWYHWFRYSLDESCGYSQEIAGNDDYKDLREAAVLLSVCSLQALMALINAQFWCSQRSEHSYWPKLAVDALTELLHKEKFLD